jgi:hypothetical protein
VLQQVSDRIERAAIITEMADYLKVERELVGSKLGPAPRGQTGQKPRAPVSSIPPNEKLLLTCLLCSADARAAIQQYLRRTDILALLELKSIFAAALRLEEEGVTFCAEALGTQLEPRMQRILSELSFADGGIGEADAVQQALHCLRALEAKSANVKCDGLRHRIQELEQAGNLEEALRLADELNRVRHAVLGG